MSDDQLTADERRAWRHDLSRHLGPVAVVPPLSHLTPSPAAFGPVKRRHWGWWSVYAMAGVGVLVAAVWTLAVNPSPSVSRVGTTAAVRRDLDHGTPLAVTAGPLRVLVIPLKAPLPEDVIRVLYVARRTPLAFTVQWGRARVRPAGRGNRTPRIEAGTAVVATPMAPKPSVPLRISWTSRGLNHVVMVPLTKAHALTVRNRREFFGQQGAYWNARYIEETVVGAQLRQRIGQLFVESVNLSPAHPSSTPVSYALSIAGGVERGSFKALSGTADWSILAPASSRVVAHPSVTVYRGKTVLATIPLRLGQEKRLPDTIADTGIHYAPLSRRPGLISAHRAEFDAQHVPGIGVRLTPGHARLARVQMPLYHGPAWLVTGTTADGPETVVINAETGQPVQSVFVHPGSTGKSGRGS